jgi:hypothetical protein
VFSGAITHRYAIRVALVAHLTVSSTYALAAAEEEWQVGIASGGANRWVAGRQRAGVMLGADAQWGVNDSWALRTGFDVNWLAGDLSPPSNFVGATLSAGGTYTLDVLRWLPFAELNVVALASAGGGTDSQVDLGPQVTAGVDYLLNRRYSLGLLAKYAYFAINAAGSDVHEGTPQLATLSLRLSYRLF